MNKGNKYTVSKCLGYYTSFTPVSKYLMDSLKDMIKGIKDSLYPISVYNSNLKWTMTYDTFYWIRSSCIGKIGFNYEVKFDLYRSSDIHKIYGIEVEFVEDDLTRKNAAVDLVYTEFDKVSFIDVDAAYPTFTLKDAIDSMTYVVRNGKGIEIRKEKEMPIYVGYGKKVTIENVIFNNPATIVFWSDGTKTIVKRQKGDKKFDPEKGLAMAVCKKIMGNKGNFNDEFKRWLPKE